jgi:RNA-dependent RNA polymerase
MEVFMRNIAFVVDEKTVIREIAAILHKPPYSDHAPNALPLNFKVFFFPNKRNPGLKHGGCGKLTLPSEAVGQLFLAEYGELAGPRRRPFFIGGRPIVFSESKTTPRADVLEEITRLPYLDPQALQEQQKIAEQFARERVRVRTVQFGWFCRDYVFSCEYERGCESGYIRFEDESRELRVKVQDKEEDVTRVIAIHFSQIDFVSVGIRNGDPVIFFSLQRPPAFETELSEFNAGIAALGLFGNRSIYDRHPRRRFSAFDAVHEETVAYSAYALRIVCTSPSDLQTFRSLWKTSGRAELQSSPPPLERRNLFSAHHREAFAAWLLQLDFGVAFQLEALTRRLVVDLTEALDLREDVKRVVSQDGPGFAAELLRSFYAEAKELMFEQSETGESPETMSQCFVRCERDLRKNPPKAKRVARLDDDIFDCYHIMVTPSSYELQGPFPERLNRVIRKFPDHMQCTCFVRIGCPFVLIISTSLRPRKLRGREPPILSG